MSKSAALRHELFKISQTERKPQVPDASHDDRRLKLALPEPAVDGDFMIRPYLIRSCNTSARQGSRSDIESQHRRTYLFVVRPSMLCLEIEPVDLPTQLPRQHTCPRYGTYLHPHRFGGEGFHLLQTSRSSFQHMAEMASKPVKKRRYFANSQLCPHGGKVLRVAGTHRRGRHCKSTPNSFCMAGCRKSQGLDINNHAQSDVPLLPVWHFPSDSRQLRFGRERSISPFQ